MSFKIFSVVSLLTLLMSCNNSSQNTTKKTDETNNEIIAKEDISKLNYKDFALDSKVKDLTEPWQAYARLSNVVNDVKKGDLSFFSDNHKEISSLVKDLKETIPETLETDSVLARITVIETMLYKLEDTSNLLNTSKDTLSKSIKSFLVSYSNLNFQLNKKIEKDSQNIVRPS